MENSERKGHENTKSQDDNFSVTKEYKSEFIAYLCKPNGILDLEHQSSTGEFFLLSRLKISR